MLDQTLEHVIEQPNLFVRKFNHAVDKQICDPAECLHSTGHRPVRKCCLQFVEQFSLDETAFALMTLSWSIHADGKLFLRFPRNGSD